MPRLPTRRPAATRQRGAAAISSPMRRAASPYVAGGDGAVEGFDDCVIEAGSDWNAHRTNCNTTCTRFVHAWHRRTRFRANSVTGRSRASASRRYRTCRWSFIPGVPGRSPPGIITRWYRTSVDRVHPPARPRKTRVARARRVMSSSVSWPIRSPSLERGTVVILSTIR